MDEVKLGLMSSILSFLRDEFRAGYLDSENAEGLEVAIHCLENIFDVSKAHKPTPLLLDLYKHYLASSVLGYRDATEEEKEQAERFKVEGNMAMNAGKYNDALDYYTRAINVHPKNAVYYCNRAAAKSKLNDHLSAIEDCKVAIELDPRYSKAYGRLGLAYCGIESYVNALDNYKKAYDLEPDNEGYRRNFQLAQQKVADFCCCPMENHNSNSSTSVHNSAPNPNNAAANTANQQISPGLDLNSILSNPQLVHIATQMLSDPNMQSMMGTVLTTQEGSSNAMHALVSAGQNLARQMQIENPDIFNEIRQTFRPEGLLPPFNDGNSNPDTNQDGGESSGNKEQ